MTNNEEEKDGIAPKKSMIKIQMIGE